MCEYCKSEYDRWYNDAIEEMNRSQSIVIVEPKKIVQWSYAKENTKLEEKLYEFLDFRKQIKKPLKPASYKAFQRKLEKLSEWNMDIACDILEESIANGWQWIFPVKNSTLSLPKKWIAQA